MQSTDRIAGCSLSRKSAPLSLFQAAHLVSVPSEQFRWSLPDCSAGLRLTPSCLYYLSTLGTRRLLNPVSLGHFLKLLTIGYSFLQSFSAGLNALTIEGTAKELQ